MRLHVHVGVARESVFTTGRIALFGAGAIDRDAPAGEAAIAGKPA